MMKRFTLLLALAVMGGTVSAQLSIEPNPVNVENVEADDFEGIGYADIINNTGSNLGLTWQRVVISITEGWTSAVCDPNQCYLPQVSSMEFSLGDGASGDMDVHVYPDDNDGAAIIQINVFKTSDPSNTDYHASATYNFNQSLGVVERLTEAIKVYPNPTQDFVNIESPQDVYRVQLFDVNGKLVESILTNGAQQFSISEVPTGNYILKMLDRESEIVSTNLLVKE